MTKTDFICENFNKIGAYMQKLMVLRWLSKKLAVGGQKISHFGFGLLILCIILNGVFSTETITNIKVGEKHNFMRYVFLNLCKF